MKLNFVIPTLALVALFTAGCEYDPGSPILAEAPGGLHGIRGIVPTEGQYTLFKVTEYDVWGEPTQTEKLKTMRLKTNEKVWFEYVVPNDQAYELDARSDLIVHGGNWTLNLGPVNTLDEHYYWANPEEWANYWSSRPERVLAKKATQY